MVENLAEKHFREFAGTTKCKELIKKKIPLKHRISLCALNPPAQKRESLLSTQVLSYMSTCTLARPNKDSGYSSIKVTVLSFFPFT